jgi:carbon storage regulator
MLVLARKSKETIQIGDQITISILRIKGNSVRIGIEAPGDVRVIRGEIASKHQDQHDTASASDMSGRPSIDSNAPQATFQAQRRLSTRRVNEIMALRRQDHQNQLREAQATLVAS